MSRHGPTGEVERLDVEASVLHAASLGAPTDRLHVSGRYSARVSFRDVHSTFAWVDIGLNVFAGSWALAAHWIVALRRRELWWAITVAYLAVFVQVLLGVILMNVNDLEPDRFHLFYGFVALAGVGIIYSYRQQLEHQKYLLYGLGGLFIAGLGLRALTLATSALS